MNISCPQCGFTRTVNENRLASATVLATCPKCGHSFRIYREDGRTELLPPPNGKPAFDSGGPDDPLPPGAVVPGGGTPAGNEAQAARNENNEGRPQSSSEQEKNERSGKASSEQDELDELRKNAADAYRRQAENADAENGDTGEDGFALENPWEHPGDNGRLNDFYQTCVRVMFAAPRFFSGLSTTSSRPKAFAFFILVTVIQIIVERLWGGVFMSYFAGSADPQLDKLLQMLAPDTSMALLLISRVASSTLQLFFDAAVFHLAFRLIVGKKADFYLIFLVLCYSTAPALLCLVPLIGSIAGFIWAAACGFVGCRYALRVSWGQTAMSMVPIYLIGIFTVLYLGRALQATLN